MKMMVDNPQEVEGERNNIKKIKVVTWLQGEYTYTDCLLHSCMLYNVPVGTH